MTSDIDISLDLSSVHLRPEPKVAAPRRKFLTQIDDSDDYLLVTDNTGLEKWKRCPATAYYYLVRGREAWAKNAALTFGGAIHAGLEAWYKGESTDAAKDAIKLYFLENPPPPDPYRTLSTALAVFEHYVRRCDPDLYLDYHMELASDSAGLLVERSFELPLGTLEVNATLSMPFWDEPRFVRRVFVAWSGKIDLIAHAQNQIRVVDHKTTSIDGEAFVSAFTLSSQTVGYVWSARQLWPELNVRGFCLNAICLKRHTEGTSLLAKGPRGGSPPLSFFRSYFEYSPERIAEWQHHTLCMAEDLMHCAVRNVYPLNDRQCFDKYGRCPYFDVCTSTDPSVRDAILSSELYTNVTWNPVNI